MEHYLEQLQMDALLSELERLFPAFSWDPEDVFSKILGGDVKGALSSVLRAAAESAAAQAEGLRGLLSFLLLVGLLSVLVSVFVESFENHQIARIAHSVFFLMLMTVLMKVLAQCCRIAGETLSFLTQFSRLAFPALCLAVVPTAGSVTALGYYEMALWIIYLSEAFLLRICLPVLSALMLLVLMNGVWEEGKLTPLAELLEKAVKWASGLILTAVAGLGFLQSMVAPVLDGLKRGALQKAISAIPALGDLAEGAAELVLGSAVLLKNSLGVFLMLGLLLLVAAPLLKLFLYGAVLRCGGALIGIIADRRICDCVNRTADAVFLTLRLVGTGAACFVILAAVMTCMAGR